MIMRNAGFNDTNKSVLTHILFIGKDCSRNMAKDSVDLLTIENVSKSFNGRCVLKNISAKLTTGKILGLVGKSAAGKSVLIHMLRGSEEYAPDKGRVLYHVNHCKKCGDLDRKVMLNTFNMGVGMMMFVDKNDAEAVVETIKAAGEKAWIIGEAVKGEGVTVC